MKTKKKICKGTNKAKGFNGCGNEVYLFRYGLCKSCFQNWVKNTDAGWEWFQKNTIKKHQKKAEEKIKIHKEILEEKKLPALLNLAKHYLHLFVRLRDKNKPCVSCGTPYNTEFQAGHYYKAETYSTTRFDEKNIHGQCRHCNLFKDGNINGYTLGIQNRLTKKEIDQLNQKALKSKHAQKWDSEELKKIINKYKIKSKELK